MGHFWATEYRPICERTSELSDDDGTLVTLCRHVYFPTLESFSWIAGRNNPISRLLPPFFSSDVVLSLFSEASLASFCPFRSLVIEKIICHRFLASEYEHPRSCPQNNQSLGTKWEIGRANISDCFATPVISRSLCWMPKYLVNGLGSRS